MSPDVTGAPVPDEAQEMIKAQTELRRKVLEKVASDPDFAKKLLAGGSKDALVDAGLEDDVQKVEQAANARLESAEVAGHSCGYFWDYYGDLWYYTY